MYGTFSLKEILPDIRKTGSEYIDLWPRPHGNQREQVREMGDEAFANLLEKYRVKLGISTCYKLGPFSLQDEMRWARKLTGRGITLVCGARGRRNLKGEELKKEIQRFVEKMKPHLEVANETGCTIAIENHSNSLIQSPDSLRFFADFTQQFPRFGLSFAPHHLPQDGEMQGRLIRELGSHIKHFYAQQLGSGSHHKQPWDKEKLQMPGRGPLDFRPLIMALRAIQFTGFTEIFMHPYPRGLPIRPAIPEITAEINFSRRYLENLLHPSPLGHP